MKNGSVKIMNMWDRIKIYCMNHDAPVKMDIIENTELIKTPFFACEHYGGKGTDPGTKPCYNRLNMDDYQGIVLSFLDFVSENEGFVDYTNYRFDYKGTRHKIGVRVLQYSDREIKLGIINKTILGVK